MGTLSSQLCKALGRSVWVTLESYCISLERWSNLMMKGFNRTHKGRKAINQGRKSQPVPDLVDYTSKIRPRLVPRIQLAFRRQARILCLIYLHQVRRRPGWSFYSQFFKTFQSSSFIILQNFFVAQSLSVLQLRPTKYPQAKTCLVIGLWEDILWITQNLVSCKVQRIER